MLSSRRAFELLVNKATIFSSRGPACAGGLPPSTAGKGRSRSREPARWGKRQAESTASEMPSALEKLRHLLQKNKVPKIKGITACLETGERAEENVIFQSNARRTIIEGKAMSFKIQLRIQN